MSNGMGGWDFAGLDFAIEFVGVDDVEGLVNRLMVIRSHKPPEEMKLPQGSDDEDD